MYENPQTVVLPEKTKMDNIISATLYLLSTGTWKANAFPYADIVQKASTPLDIIYCLDRSSRLSAVNFLFTLMSRDDLSQTLPEAWSSSEFPNMDLRAGP